MSLLHDFWNRKLTFEREHFSIEELSKEQLIQQVHVHIQKKFNAKAKHNKWTLEHTSAWATIDVNLTVEKLKNNNFRIQLHYSVLPVLLTSLSFIIIALLVGRFNSINYFLIGLSLSILYSFIHSFIIEHSLYSFFRNFPLYYHLSPSILLEQDQEFWLTQPNTCSACGTVVSEYEQNCIQCNTLVNKNPKVPPYNISKYTAQHFKYSYKPKKK